MVEACFLDRGTFRLRQPIEMVLQLCARFGVLWNDASSGHARRLEEQVEELSREMTEAQRRTVTSFRSLAARRGALLADFANLLA
mmetsp:Transcript_19441/g.54624  ORF Transcript_19441/g.54624 Transcript_19441/m.54624 type:complete len:85 (+) Transcript_19441:1741-1995(+)